MFGSWVIRTPTGRYCFRLRDPASALIVVEPPRRETLWFFALSDLTSAEPVVLAEAIALYEALTGWSLTLTVRATERRLVDEIAYELQRAIEDGRLDFERLLEPTGWREEPAPISTPFDPTPSAVHWIDLEILDDESLEPVAGILVTLKLADGSTTQRTTNAEGRIHVDGQPMNGWEIIDVQAPVEVVGVG